MSYNVPRRAQTRRVRIHENASLTSARLIVEEGTVVVVALAERARIALGRLERVDDVTLAEATVAHAATLANLVTEDAPECRH